MDCKLHQARLILFAALWLSAATAFSQSLLTSKQWRDSLEVLNGQIATSAWSSDLHLRKAAVNMELKQWEYAVDEYGLVLQKEPDNPAALFYRAYANTHLRRPVSLICSLQPRGQTMQVSSVISLTPFPSGRPA